MKITSIQASNILGAKHIAAQLPKPVTLFAGKNGAGKSSLQEAVRMALTGETVRVGLKKDFGALVTDGQKSGFVEVTTADSTYSVVLPSGKGNHSDNATLPFVLDAQRFARMDDKERRSFLFGLMGVKMDSAAITQRLLARGCDNQKVVLITPHLRAGFDAAQKEAEAKARDAKASWKTVTGGETWGKDKAGKWAPAPLPAAATKAQALYENAREQLAATEKALGEAQQALGAAQSQATQRKQQAAQREALVEKAGKIGRIKEKLAVDEAELAEWTAKVEDARVKAGVAQANQKAPGEFLLRGLASVTDDFLIIANNNPGQFDEGLINRASAHLVEYKKLHGWPHYSKDQPDPDAAAKLPEYEKALTLLTSMVTNGKRDLADAEQAAATLAQIEQDSGAQVDVEGAQANVAELSSRAAGWRTDAEGYRALMDKAAQQKVVADKAADLHVDVLEWTEISDALAPDGIPGELLTEALGPINERLHVSAGFAEWERVTIHPDMRITYGLRDYALISESETWRADAMIAEAVSFLAGVKLLVLDRFDVLDLKGREDLLFWLDGMAEDGEIDTALVFGTLKSLPASLPERIGAVWIEGGVAGEMREAA